jgi:hypothetical protein
MFRIVASASDFDWTYVETIAVFEDESVANLVSEGLTNLSDGERHRRGLGKDLTFTVKPVKVVRALSESRVNGLVQSILDEHWPRR